MFLFRDDLSLPLEVVRKRRGEHKPRAHGLPASMVVRWRRSPSASDENRQQNALEECELQIWQKGLQSNGWQIPTAASWTKLNGQLHRLAQRYGSSPNTSGNESLRVAQKETFTYFYGRGFSRRRSTSLNGLFGVEKRGKVVEPTGAPEWSSTLHRQTHGPWRPDLQDQPLVYCDGGGVEKRLRFASPPPEGAELPPGSEIRKGEGHTAFFRRKCMQHLAPPQQPL